MEHLHRRTVSRAGAAPAGALAAGLGALVLLAGCGDLSAAAQGATSAPHGEETAERTSMSASEGHSDGHDGPTNRLAGESSPYLLLHKHNPVQWYPWGPEALEKARKEDKPIFLSVGYSTCYWCHVMERESFSNPEIAALLNEHFVAIKVDREERPDLDEIYMAATQILTKHGGWPNSVFLTPELVPFFAGTYFPPVDTGGRPGFKTIVTGLADAWRDRRSQVESSADQIAGMMRQYLEQQMAPGAELPGRAPAREGFESLRQRYDSHHGGFGGAPKFPTPSNLLLLLELVETQPEDHPQALEMLSGTLAAMARGGIYDQLAGGFHRYSTDAQWLVPHFEKMLYDNGFLLEIYARHAVSQASAGARAESRRIVEETAAFLAEEMTSEEGALWSAIDAETEAEEGAYYVWSRPELEEILGAETAAGLAPIYGFDGAPTFEGGRHVLHLSKPLEDPGAMAPLRDKILAARWLRERPLTDDKILTDWNGIGIAGLAVAGELLENPKLLAQASKAADFVLGHLRPENSPLLHTWRGGEAKIPAYLGDYAFFVRGLLALHRATGEKRWLKAAEELTEEQIRRLADTENGGFFVAEARPDLLLRSKDIFDGALPSPNGVAAENLLNLHRATGEARWRQEAEKALKAFAPMLERSPEGLRMMSIAAYRAGSPAGGKPREGKAPAVKVATSAVSTLERQAATAVEAQGQLGKATGDGFRAFVVQLRIADGWHVNAHPASQEFLIPTRLEAGDGELRDLSYPAGEPFRAAFSEEEISVYAGEVILSGEIKVKDTDGAEGIVSPAVRLTYQACDEEKCLPPSTRRVTLTGSALAEP